MNPLTQVKRTQKITAREAELGISEDASWHAKYKNSAYIFVGGIPFDLTEGDLLAVFAQYGEIVDVNLLRNKSTGKSRGFAFIAYEDQRSTILAVDNFNGAKVLGRIIRVDHVADYKKKKEIEEEEQNKREERGVCHAYQKGECHRGASCKFSHDENGCTNTGWGPKDGESRWGHDKYQGPSKGRHDRHKDSDDRPKDSVDDRHARSRRHDMDDHRSVTGNADNERYKSSHRLATSPTGYTDRRESKKHRNGHRPSISPHEEMDGRGRRSHR